MNTLKLYRKLLKYMYDEYNNGNNASGHGEHIQILINQFQRSSRENRIGDAHDQIGAVSYFLKNGLIDAVDTSGNKISNSMTAYTYGRMLPTQKGIDYIRLGHIQTAEAVASVSGTFFGKLFKSIFGN